MIINKLEKKDLECMIKMLFIFYCIISVLGFYDYFKIYNGYSPVWLIYLYILGAYIKLYSFPRIINKKVQMISILIFNILVMFSSSVIMKLFTTKFIGHAVYENFLIQYNSPFILINSLIIFLLIYDVNLKSDKIKFFLERIGKYAFEVYIIHAHYLIISSILPKLSNRIIINNNLILILISLLFEIISVYIVCIIFGIFRLKLFNSFYIDKIIDKLGCWLDSALLISKYD